MTIKSSSALFSSLAASQAFRAVASNSAWLLFDRFARMGLALAVGVWTARYLGPERYGELYFVLAFLALFQSAAPLGLDAVVVRDLAVDRTEAGAILGATFAVRLAAGVACFGLAVGGLALWRGPGSREVMLCALAAGGLIFQAFDTVDLWFQSRSQSRRTIVPKLVAYLCASAFKVMAIIQAAPLLVFALVQTMDGLIAAVGLCVAYRLFPAGQPLKATLERAEKQVRESFPYMLGAVAIVVYMRIDQLMVVHLLGYEASGVYAAVVPLSTVWTVIPTTLAVSLAPFIARKKNESEAAYYDSLTLVFRVFGSFGLLSSIVTAAAAPLIVGLLFGEQYKGADQLLAIHAFGNFFVFQGVAQGLWVVNEREGRLAVWRVLIGACVSICANVVLLPIMGLRGAAVSYILSQACAAIFLNLVFAPNIFIMQFGFSRPRRRLSFAPKREAVMTREVS
ncbi:flippase [Methylosinus sp. Sm6]|uniref:flippase n=1 Tax=Methylosinus sp. Sm6 TaxID=2866948 RepID=UPI001C997798|nr:flippase [Methylosinus sp. Sm6]